MTRYAAVLLALHIFVPSPLQASEEGPVWSWFATCGGPVMTLQVRFDATTVYEASFPICRAERDSAASQGQSKGRMHFSFKPGRAIVWSGYRDTDEKTSPRTSLQVDVWQAGADSDDLLIGSVFADSKRIRMNTIHIARPNARAETEVAKGLVVITYPATSTSGP